MSKAELAKLKKSIEDLSLEDKREFFSEVVPEICDSSLTTVSNVFLSQRTGIRIRF